MLSLSMPKTFKIGDTAPARINKKPSTATWRDSTTLVLGDDDVRVIIHAQVDGDAVYFTCGDAGDVKEDYAVTSDLGCTSVSRQTPWR